MDNVLLGGLSSSLATCFTNPLELVKTRLQLQGELVKKGSTVEPYRNLFQGLVQIWKHEGIFALQKGLVASLYFQFILNACRLGIYNTAFEYGWTRNKDGKVSFLKSAFFGGVGGTIGQGLASPFFMLRNHLQSASVRNIAVGYQHQHESFTQAFVKIYRSYGFSGLYRGVLVTVPRGMMGSGSQIAAFGYVKDFLQRNFSEQLDPSTISLMSGCAAGTVMTIFMNPTDVMSTRLYNQGVDKKGAGIYYNGVTDCALKILKHEGVAGFYKGFWPHYVRLGPHSALVLFFFDELKSLKLFNKISRL